MSAPNLIQCGDHQWAPFAIVCVHLMEGTAKQWMLLKAEEGSEVEYDYLCPTCFANFEAEGDEHDITDLRCVCIHCLRKIKEGR